MSHSPAIVRPCRRGFSMVGMLITMVCMVVLFAILMNSLNSAVTGQKSQLPGTVDSMKDTLYLNALYQSMFVHAEENKGQFLVPSHVARSDDASLNTTANLYSAMLMDNYTVPKQLISGNEYSPYVEEMLDYNYTAYDAGKGVFWDKNFVADLHKVSNVSFGHLVLCGDRFEKKWRTTLESTFPLLGNRGPKDGVNNPKSYACGRDGVWRGHMVFGDGHIDFIDSPTPNGLTFIEEGQPVQDCIFSLEDGPNGMDAVISFTKSMSKSGPELQFD